MSSLPHQPSRIRPTDAKEQIRDNALSLRHKTPQTMDTDRNNGTGTLRYSDIFLAMYSDNGMSCLHRNHSHVLVYMYSGKCSPSRHSRRTGAGSLYGYR